MDDTGLAAFHPLVREWFLGRYDRPTPIQAATWPRIAAGEHVLALAPTGSGKTLAAFLGALSRLFSGELPADRCSVLYVSPLKALGEDMRLNLEEPLRGIAELFARRGLASPDPKVAVRSGDTSQAERRRILLHPPSILVTTPESLGLMLDSPVARNLLAGLRLVIVDELHSLAGNKRGALFACELGRLALLAGEFQRVGLSATVSPPEVAASFLGGRQLMREGTGTASYRNRPVAIIAPASEKRLELRIDWPVAAAAAASPVAADVAAAAASPVAADAVAVAASPVAADAVAVAASPVAADGSGAGAAAAVATATSRYEAIVSAILARMASARGLLVFTDSRRRAERLAFLLNEAAGRSVAWAHHGSLSKETRRSIEERFKAGEIGCVVATSSLELGIDIGHVDEVVLAGSPRSAASALQRIGRAGHRVGEISRALLLPFHGMDLLLAAAVFRGVQERAIEELRPPSCPLDILAQVLLKLVAEGPHGVDELYDIVLSFPPFERLTRRLFDSVVEMLAGRYAGSRVRELERRAYLDRSGGILVAAEGARMLLYSSGGAIPDRGLFSLRLSGSRTKIGELDEEFVWERRAGEVFTLGAQTWKIVDIGEEAVEVVPAPPDPDIIPFWKGEASFRSPELSLRVLALLDELSDLDPEEGAELLVRSCSFSPEAARVCSAFVESQKAAAATAACSTAAPVDGTAAVSGSPGAGSGGIGRGSSFPGRRRLVLEVQADPASRRDQLRLVLHTLRGRSLNEPLALAASAAWEEKLGLPVETVADDDWILFVASRAPGHEPAAELVGVLAGLATPGRLVELVRLSLEGSGLFGAQFRENAGRALLLPRGLPGRRSPLWMTRLRAKRLFEAVRSFPDFPVVVESWRSCLVDLLDLDGAAALLGDLAEGRIEVSVIETRSPTPFAREAVWRETGEFMYRDDRLLGRAASSVSSRVIEEALRSSASRPRLEAGLLDDFARRVKRLLPGWGASDGLEFAEWVRERVAVPLDELSAMLEAGSPELRDALSADPGLGGRLRRLLLPGAELELLVHAERERELAAEPEACLTQWLRREGVVTTARLCSLFGFSPEGLDAMLEELSAEGIVVVGALASGSDELEVVDAQNFELLLRRARASRRARVEARPAADLMRFVAAVQGLGGRSVPANGRSAALAAVLDRLAGAPLTVDSLETEVLPPRLPGYRPGELDELFSGGGWSWFGCGRETIALCRTEELELFLGDAPEPAWAAAGPARDRSRNRPSSVENAERAATQDSAAPGAGRGAPRGGPATQDSAAPGAGRGAPRGGPASRLLEPGSPPEDFWAIRERLGLGSRELAIALWKEAWKGLVASDAYASVREALGQGFGVAMPELAEGAGAAGGRPFGSRRRLPRSLRALWRSGPPVAGRWFSLAFDDEPDTLDEEALAADRVRVLCRRYGLICRALFERELPPLSWRAVFAAARRLELAGELVAGRFFEGLDGPQFMESASLRLFGELGASEKAAAGEPGAELPAVWIGSQDPAAAAAYAPAERPVALPPRLPTSRLCLLGGRVVAASRRSWRSLDFAIPPDDPALVSVLSALRDLRERAVAPERRIAVEKLNGLRAADSPYVSALVATGFEPDRGRMVLW